jgi:hypothetical protein
MFSLAIFGGNKIDGSDLQPAERAVGLALFGAMELDLSNTPAPFVDVLVIALFGGVVVKVAPGREVRLTGFDLFGGRNLERRRLSPPRGAGAGAGSESDDGSEELPLDIQAYAVFGGVHVKRVDQPAVAEAVAQ